MASPGDRQGTNGRGTNEQGTSEQGTNERAAATQARYYSVLNRMQLLLIARRFDELLPDLDAAVQPPTDEFRDGRGGFLDEADLI